MSKLLIELVLTPESARSATLWFGETINAGARIALIHDGQVHYPVWCWANSRFGRESAALPNHTVQLAMLLALEGVEHGQWSINAPAQVAEVRKAPPRELSREEVSSRLQARELEEFAARPWTTDHHMQLHALEHERLSRLEDGLDNVWNPENGMRADVVALQDRVEKLAAVIVLNRNEARDATDPLPERFGRLTKRIDAVYADLDRKLRDIVHRFENQIPIPPPPPQPEPESTLEPRKFINGLTGLPFPDVAPTAYYDIVFDGPPGHESGRFIEAEDDQGRSVNLGKWVRRPGDGGWWALRIPASRFHGSTSCRLNTDDDHPPDLTPVELERRIHELSERVMSFGALNRWKTAVDLQLAVLKAQQPVDTRAGTPEGRFYSERDIDLLQVMAVEAAGERRMATRIGRVMQAVETDYKQIRADGPSHNVHDLLDRAVDELAAVDPADDIDLTYKEIRLRIVYAAALVVAAIERLDEGLIVIHEEPPLASDEVVLEKLGEKLAAAQVPTLAELGVVPGVNESPPAVLESPGGDPTSLPEGQSRPSWAKKLGDLCALVEPALADAESKPEPLGRFGHHPDTVIDYEMEVEILDGLTYDALNCQRALLPVLDRVRVALEFRVGGDESAVSAKASLRDLEKKLVDLDKTRREADEIAGLRPLEVPRG